jgi:hypothetical protein
VLISEVFMYCVSYQMLFINIAQTSLPTCQECHWEFCIGAAIFPGDKDSWCIGLTTSPPSFVCFLEIWESHPRGTVTACPDLLRGLLYLVCTLQSLCGYSAAWSFVWVLCCMEFCVGTLLHGVLCGYFAVWTSCRYCSMEFCVGTLQYGVLCGYSAVGSFVWVFCHMDFV